MTPQFSLNWAFAHGEPTLSAIFRRTPEDFVVDEDLGFELSGEGEHVYLQLQKRGDNTAWLARHIARLAGVGNNDVGYAGLKDRHAVTRQWFSVYFPKGNEPDWSQLESESVQLLRVERHRQKLRRGMHRANRFQIKLHQLSGDGVDSLVPRLGVIKDQGVPNYFGLQRFGREGNNLLEAQRILVDDGRIKNRQQRGLILSAARSYLFNGVLSQRVRDGSWCSIIDGDVPHAGVPTGPLWGRGRLASSADCLALEHAALEPCRDWCNGLEHVGLTQERRPLVMMAQSLDYSIMADSLHLSFALPPGCFATSLLREICRLKEASFEPDML